MSTTTTTARIHLDGTAADGPANKGERPITDTAVPPPAQAGIGAAAVAGASPCGDAPAAQEDSPGTAGARPVPRVKTLRRALGLTQEAFAARYRIPLGTLRDWEQGRTEPDQPARAYIKVIASNPEWVSIALAGEPG
jgi:putative transcriptional regulator